MILNRSRQIIFTMLFLIYFIVYAISPLSITFAGKSDIANSSVAGRAASFSENIHIWSWELIFAKFSVKNGSSHSPSTIQVLMRKARAIIPDNTVMKSILSEKSALLPINLLSLPVDLLSGVTVSFDIGRSLEGFCSLYSGLSPPFV
ncbi:MAG: hypothetical protein ABSA46_07800 [Thermodesulfovibrionales bacterium]|jgi:hypothetical protein